MKSYRFFKRALDICFSSLMMILLLPVLVGISILIKLESTGPVIFRQKRVGKDLKYFDILKFRTMYIDTPKDQPTHLLGDPEKHITGIGRILRKTSLDELPQLWNILKGDMSFVGPRPALWNQEDLISARELHGANAIQPGLTGWAQVNGRDELPIPVKATFDGDYVKRKNLWFDFKCLYLTVIHVFMGTGIREGVKPEADQKEI